MTDSTRLFDVHLYAIVRRTIAKIAADSPAAAVAQAQQHPSVAAWLRRLDDPQGAGEFAEEFSHYLVDVVGDDDFEQSRWFHAAESPLLEILRNLFRGDDTGRDPEQLPDLLQEVRQILSRCL